MPLRTLSWLRVAVAWLVTAGAVLYLYHVSAMALVLIAVVWSALLAIAMQSAIRSAPSENWTREVPQVPSKRVWAVFLGVLLFPAFVVILWAGLLAATCVAWIILAASSLMHKILGRLLGEMNPRHNSPHTAKTINP